MPSLTGRHWRIRPQAPPEHLQRFPHLHPVVVQLLYNRGIVEPVDVVAFLNRERPPDNPFRLRGLPRAVERIRHAIRKGERIVVYGDFDADGVTSSALMVTVLRALGANVRVYIPHRVDEGYGLNVEAIKRIADADVRLLVTVDCGIRSVAEVDYAQSLGVDVVLTDHHSVGPQLPPALTVVNPKREDETYPFKGLAGVGVAYKLAQALLRVEKHVPTLRGHDVELLEDDLLDLVALGTVADIVPLVGENRALVAAGLERLNEPERPGILALMQAAGVRPGTVNTMTIGFMLAPRLNAAGRLASAKLAYKLLMASDMGEAVSLAAQLNALNRQRQQLTLRAVERAQAQLAEQVDSPIYFVKDPEFLPGIVGLIAGQIANQAYRPTFAVHLEEETSRGSARSIPEFHVTRALDQTADLLVRHGGHAAAAGFTVRNENLPALRERLEEVARATFGDSLPRPALGVDVELDLKQVDMDFYRQVRALAPFGEENPEPVFLTRGLQVREARPVGSEGKHLKLVLEHHGRMWPAIAFKMGNLFPRLPRSVDVVYHLGLNEWNEERTLQLVVVDLGPSVSLSV